jgi:hypothetical protein
MGNTGSQAQRPRMENYEEEDYEDNRQVRVQEKSWAQKYWWVFLIVSILICFAFVYLIKKDGKDKYFKKDQ